MRSAYSCTAYRARVRKCKVLENYLRSCFKLEVDRCSHDSLWTNDQTLCHYTDRGREKKPNGARRQNALTFALVGGGVILAPPVVFRG